MAPSRFHLLHVLDESQSHVTLPADPGGYIRLVSRDARVRMELGLKQSHGVKARLDQLGVDWIGGVRPNLGVPVTAIGQSVARIMHEV